MKRDIDLVRKILIILNQEEGGDLGQNFHGRLNAIQSKKLTVTSQLWKKPD